ncbi:MAG: type VI secretion system tip protein TssI/VgrG [Polyangiaceae bacterium]
MVAKLEASSLGSDLRIVTFRGSEALGRPYQFVIQLMLASGATADPAGAIGSDATLTLSRKSDDEPHEINGILSSVSLLAQTADWSLYEAVLVPKLWRLGLSRHSNAFTKMTIPDIMKAVLESAGLSSQDFEFRLSGSYAEEELVVQYRESDLDFIHRWMEHEGIYYFFEHKDGAAKAVFVDQKGSHVKLADKTMRYRPTDARDQSAAEALDEFRVHFNSTVKSVKLRDYDYSRPMLDVSASSDVSDRGVGEINLHRGRFWDPAQAQHYAKLRAEELKAQEVVVHGGGTVLHVGAGYLFEVSEHPGDYNKKYLATEVQHFGNQTSALGIGIMGRLPKPPFDDVYRVQITALESSIQYRLPRSTPRPRVWGYEAGVVDGASDDSPYAQIDDQGRYLVKFHFDESDRSGGKASTFVRMMQPHGGTTEGFHFPLRKGTEVIFTFQGGDPDRPVIAGVVPNITTPSPVVDANHTQNVIRTGSNNHIVLEDKQGQEFIDIQTPRHGTGLYMGHPKGITVSQFDGEKPAWDEFDDGSVWLTTAGTSIFTFNGNFWCYTGGDFSEWVVGPVDKHFNATHKLFIKGTSDEEYKAFRNTTITSGRTDKVLGGGMLQEISDGFTQIIKSGGGKQDVTGGWIHHVTDVFTSKYDAAWNITAKSYTATVADAVTITCTGGNTMLHAAGGNNTIKASGKIIFDAPEVDNQAPGQWLVKTPIQVEFFGMKNAVGINSNEANGIKSEHTGYSAGLFGVKGESVGINDLTYIGLFQTLGSHIKTAATAIKNGAVAVGKHAITVAS